MSGEREGRQGAERFRRDHQLGDQPISDLITVVEQACDADVTIVEHGDDAHGMTVRHGNTTIIGVVRTRHPMRQRSTVAHEVGHWMFDDLVCASPQHQWGERSREEIRADAFARHLLLPLTGLKKRVGRRTPNEAVLSELVQLFGASPAIVSIQLREARLITPERCKEWSSLSTPTLATRYGWQALYASMRAESDTLRPPQRLLARATAGYAEGVISAAMLARLNGTHDVAKTREELEAAGIVPRPLSEPVPPARPRATDDALTSAELDALLADLDD